MLDRIRMQRSSVGANHIQGCQKWWPSVFSEPSEPKSRCWFSHSEGSEPLPRCWFALSEGSECLPGFWFARSETSDPLSGRRAVIQKVLNAFGATVGIFLLNFEFFLTSTLFLIIFLEASVAIGLN